MKAINCALFVASLTGLRCTASAIDGNRQRPIFETTAATSNSEPHSAPAYRDSLLSLHKRLIDIPSVTDGGHEDKAAHFLVDYLEGRGYATQLQQVPPREGSPPDQKRWNLLAWPGADNTQLSSRKPRVLITSHIDVVPPWIPYSISASDEANIGPDTVISGRGSVDAKASVAAQITAVEEILAVGDVPPEDLMLLYVVGEETVGDGMKNFSAWWRDEHPGMEFDAAIFGEPTGNKLACGHKGIMGGWLYAKGKAGHSGYPELGKSATELLVRALAKIVDADLGSNELYGKTTVNIGRLTGGVAGNVIAKDAGALVTIRVAAGNFTSGPGIVQERINTILQETDEEAFSVNWPYSYGPVDCNCDVEGFETVVVNYGTDVPNLQGNHTSYLYGPGTILVAHGDKEALRVRDLEEAVEGLKKIIKHALSH